MKNIHDITKKYFTLFPQDKENLIAFVEQLSQDTNLFDRKNFKGHVVANALVLNSQHEVLTVFHNKLQMYLQPGGHIDLADISILNASIRELVEETGISDVIVDEWHNISGIPIFIESHLIPENKKKNEEAHYHHDFMYIFKTNNTDIHLQLDEISDFKWIPISTVLTENPESFIGKAIQKMINMKINK